VRGAQVLPWLQGTIDACKMMPKMLKKRREIFSQRKVSLRYLEEIIMDSERDLMASKRRLNQQTLAALSGKALERVGAK
jgi:hypothetical protein